MEDVACDLCGGRETDEKLREGEWAVVRCRSCSLTYLNPRPEPEVIEKDYDWFRHAPLQRERQRSTESQVRAALRKARGKGVLRRKPRVQVVAERIQEFVPGGRLLDVGCGDGYMVEAMDKFGFESHGLDISDIAVEEAHSQGRPTVRKGTIHAAPFPPEHFDAILLMSYLEHEHYPAQALAKARDLLKPATGHLFIKVPHYGCWNRVMLGRRWCGYFFPQHLYYFTPHTLAGILEKVGLEVVRNGFWDHVPVSDVFWIAAKRPAIA